MAIRKVTQAALLAALLVCTLPVAAWAVSPKEWKSKGSSGFGSGKMDDVTVRSDGELSLALKFDKLPSKEVAIWCSVTSSTGVTYFGTGKAGTVYKLVGDKMVKVVENTGFIVSALAADNKGNVYAASLPGGQITIIPAKGNPRPLVKLPALYVWALACDSQGNLFAATGPTGILYRITQKGVAGVLYDSKADHIFSVALDAKDNVFFGTADGATLMRINAKDRMENKEKVKASVVFDFAGNEIKAIQAVGNDLFVAVNNTRSGGPERSMSEAMYRAASSSKSSKSGVSTGYRASAGSVFKISPGDARPTQIVKGSSSNFITAMKVDKSGRIFVATSAGGYVMRFAADGQTSIRIAIKEKMIQTMNLKNGALHLIGTSSPGTLYRRTAGARKGTFTSRVYTNGIPARWGNLHWEGAGVLGMEARGGDTGNPEDETWTKWKPVAKSGAAVGLGESKHFQYRVTWTGPAAGSATLREVRLSYLPKNVRPVIREVTISSGSHRSSSKKGKRIAWKATDPNGDTLGYRVYYRLTSSPGWHLLNPKKLLFRPEYTLDPDKMIAGEYVFRVVASDEKSNLGGKHLISTKESKPYLLDNGTPVVTVKIAVAGMVATISGSATDDVGIIKRLQYCVDGGEWTTVVPADEILDARSETFSLKVTLKAKGAHTIAIRVADNSGNSGVVQKTFQVK